MADLDRSPKTLYRQLSGYTAITIRHFRGDLSAFAAVKAQSLDWPQAPGALTGVDPWLAWRGPGEVIAVGMNEKPLQEVLKALAPGQSLTAMTADLSEALAVFELVGPGLDAWLAHLVDANSIPGSAGHATRCRLADGAVILLRLEAQRIWLLADKPIAPYINQWLAYGHQGAFVASAMTV